MFSRENGTSCAYNKQYLSHTLAHASGPLLTHISDTHTSSYACILCKLLFTRVKGLENVIVLSTAHYRGINTCLCAHLAFVTRCFLMHFVSKMICSLHLLFYHIAAVTVFNSLRIPRIVPSFLFPPFTSFLTSLMFNQFLSYLRTQINLLTGI